MGKGPHGGYKSSAQRKAVHASKADGGRGAPNKMIVTPSQQRSSKDLGTQFDEMQMKIENDAKERKQQEMIQRENQDPQIALNQNVNEEENLTVEQKIEKGINALREKALQGDYDGYEPGKKIKIPVGLVESSTYKAKPETRSFNKNDALSLQQGSALAMIKNILKSKK